MATVDTGLHHTHPTIVGLHQQLLKLHFQFQYYLNFRFKVTYRRAINATIRQPIPVIYNSISGETAIRFCTVPLCLYLFRPWLSIQWISAVPIGQLPPI